MISILDTETTDLNGKLCQIGRLTLDDSFKELSSLETLVNPEEPISPSASCVHFIRDDMVEDKPLFKDVCDQYIPTEGWLVGHNIDFDIRIMNNSLSNGDEDASESDCEASGECLVVKEGVRVLDTLKLAQELYTKSQAGGNHKLGTLYHKFECYKDMPEGLGFSHDAGFDVKMTSLVLQHMLKEYNLTMEDAWKLCNKEPKDYLCTMKKYKESGKTWEEVLDEDRSYCEWLVVNNDFKWVKKGKEVKVWLEDKLFGDK